MATNVYVDGFNLYYGLERVHQAYPNSSYKWLDIAGLATTVWPALGPLHRVRYFTALVQPMPHDLNVAVRQQTYLRALTARRVEIQLGQFKKRTKQLHLRGASPQLPAAIDRLVVSAEAHITKYDEKGSDVNLAAFLVRDAALGDCDRAIVISNDSDLVEAIEMSQRDFAVPVYVISPAKRGVNQIRNTAAGIRSLKPAAVLHNQLPMLMHDAKGSFAKPSSW